MTKRSVDEDDMPLCEGPADACGKKQKRSSDSASDEDELGDDYDADSSWEPSDAGDGFRSDQETDLCAGSRYGTRSRGGVAFPVDTDGVNAIMDRADADVESDMSSTTDDDGDDDESESEEDEEDEGESDEEDGESETEDDEYSDDDSFVTSDEDSDAEGPSELIRCDAGIPALSDHADAHAGSADGSA
jgi:hypothetical protein